MCVTDNLIKLFFFFLKKKQLYNFVLVLVK